ncbi:MAG: zinc ribbon domain-containing protein [Phycisphaerales bacterium]
MTRQRWSDDGAYRTGWHRSLESGFFALALGSAFLGGAFVAMSALSLLWSDLADKTISRARDLVGAVPITLVAAASLSLLYGFVALARGARRPLDVVAPITLTAGVFGLVAGGGLELIALYRGGPRPSHALIGVLSIVAILLGVLLSGRAFRLFAARLAIDPSAAASTGRHLRLVTYLALAIGVALPFLPMGFVNLTPRECALRTAALGSAVFSLPLIASCVALVRLIRSADRSLRDLGHCPRCGYPRPPGARCPECGLAIDSASHPVA